VEVGEIFEQVHFGELALGVEFFETLLGRGLAGKRRDV